MILCILLLLCNSPSTFVFGWQQDKVSNSLKSAEEELQDLKNFFNRISSIFFIFHSLSFMFMLKLSTLRNQANNWQQEGIFILDYDPNIEILNASC